MPRTTLICNDLPAPVDGAALSACVDQVWVTETSLTSLSGAEQSQLFAAVALFFASIFVWRLLRKVL